MNERIEELMAEVGMSVNYLTNTKQIVLIEKFAELIVAECVIQCEREWIRHGTDSVHNQAIHGCINSIKKHFGVKE